MVYTTWVITLATLLSSIVVTALYGSGNVAVIILLSIAMFFHVVVTGAIFAVLNERMTPIDSKRWCWLWVPWTATIGCTVASIVLVAQDPAFALHAMVVGALATGLSIDVLFVCLSYKIPVVDVRPPPERECSSVTIV
jgi:hypothetical protein